MIDLFIKFGESRYINDMYHREYLYFQPLNNFRGVPEETGRMDPNEGNLSNYNFMNPIIESSNSQLTELIEISSNIKIHLTEFFPDFYHKNCSLYHVKNRNIFSIDERMKSRKLDTALVISKPEKFFDILEKSFLRMKLEYSWRDVFYYDINKHHGETPLHYKDQEFSFQNEFRILSYVKNDKALKLKIPGLKGCSKVLSSNEVNSTNLKFDDF